MDPSRHFTHYWSNSTWAAYRATAARGELVDYAAGNQFRERGVAPGDSLYIVTVLRGALYLLTCLQVAVGYIHVHHLRPLASIGAEYVLDPLTDLVPVCPNCHAVMHLRADEPYSIEEIRAFLGGRE